MRIKDRKISGDYTTLEPLLILFIIILIVSGFINYRNTSAEARKVNELSNEIDIGFQKMVIGEIKNTYIIKKADSTVICSVLIIKQKDKWKVIEVENEVVDKSNRKDIHESCSLKHDEISIKFSQPILEIKKPHQ